MNDCKPALNRRQLAALLGVFGLSPDVLHAQDAAKVEPHLYRVVLENDKVRVLEYASEPGTGVCGVGKHWHPGACDGAAHAGESASHAGRWRPHRDRRSSRRRLLGARGDAHHRERRTRLRTRLCHRDQGCELEARHGHDMIPAGRGGPFARLSDRWRHSARDSPSARLAAQPASSTMVTDCGASPAGA